MRAIIACNWKTNPTTFKEAKKLFEATSKAANEQRSVSVVVAPPALYLRDLSRGYRGKISFASQGARAEDSGAFTSELSLAQMKDSRASFAIVGHAERRGKGETNEEVAAEVQRALALSLSPILCVGERARTADGAHYAFVKEQLRSAVVGLKPAQIKKCVVAYEPVWAIGAAKPMTPRDMHEMSIFIRKTLVEMLGAPAMDIRILYGGAIDVTTAPGMMKEGDVHGLLVGRASAETHSISQLIHTIGEL
jgi:triosephosphate isomerase